MSDVLTFANFGPVNADKQDIYRIGADESGANGVVPELAQIFNYDLSETPDVENLGGLIGAVGPAKELQQNIERVREVLGTDQDALSIARDLVVRSGLLIPVERYFDDGFAFEEGLDVQIAVMTGGVRNWMARRAIRLAQFSGKYEVGQAVLVGGSRAMKTGEGKDVIEGMTEADYLEEVVNPQLTNVGLETQVVRVNTQVGDEVMAGGARYIAEAVDLDDSNNTIAVVSNAGAWIQNAGQMRRALIAEVDDFDSDSFSGRLVVASDSFRLGEAGTEPTTTHQNPLSALGQIARNAQELARHFPNEQANYLF